VPKEHLWHALWHAVVFEQPIKPIYLNNMNTL
jgi:hypothetical protein